MPKSAAKLKPPNHSQIRKQGHVNTFMSYINRICQRVPQNGNQLVIVRLENNVSATKNQLITIISNKAQEKYRAKSKDPINSETDRQTRSYAHYQNEI